MPKKIPQGKMTRTLWSVRLHEAGHSVAEACRIAGIHPTALYAELRDRRNRGVCECCGQKLPTK